IFYYYFALVTLAGLAVDAVKRWAWVSALALIFAFVAAWALYAGGGGSENLLGFALIVTAGAVTIPRREICPTHDGAMSWEFVRNRLDTAVRWPEFPTRLAAGAFGGAAASAAWIGLRDPGLAESWMVITTLSILYLAASLWFVRAPALSDLAVLPAVLFLAVIVALARENASLYGLFQFGMARAPETAPPPAVTILVLLALIGSALAMWRTLWGGPYAQVWAAGAALLAPLALILVEIFWQPALVLGDGRWATHAVVIAAAMAYFGERVARRDGEDKRRVAYFALSALTMISFAFIVILSQAALTLALAVMVVGAAMLDRRLNLPLLTLFVQAGVVVIGWRLVINPGIVWGYYAEFWEAMLAYIGAAVLLGVALFALA
ncbi:MAG: DUF2339 domain-containing protein, partial [Paracoccaceae bacterium]